MFCGKLLRTKASVSKPPTKAIKKCGNGVLKHKSQKFRHMAAHVFFRKQATKR